MRGWSLLAGLGITALLVWAWIDRGAEPLHQIVTPVTLPASGS